jgi:hypothetical protein
MLWIDESDTLRKNKIFELITMKFAGMSDGDVLMGLMNLPSPIPQKSESFDLMKLFLIPLLQKMNQNPIDNLIKYQSLLSKNIPLDFKDISNRIKYFKSSQKPIPKLLDEKQDTDVLEISKDGKKQSTPSTDVFVKHTGKLSFKRVSSKSFTSPKNIDKTNFLNPQMISNLMYQIYNLKLKK